MAAIKVGLLVAAFSYVVVATSPPESPSPAAISDTELLQEESQDFAHSPQFAEPRHHQVIADPQYGSDSPRVALPDTSSLEQGRRYNVQQGVALGAGQREAGYLPDTVTGQEQLLGLRQSAQNARGSEQGSYSAQAQDQILEQQQQEYQDNSYRSQSFDTHVQRQGETAAHLADSRFSQSQAFDQSLQRQEPVGGQRQSQNLRPEALSAEADFNERRSQSRYDSDLEYERTQTEEQRRRYQSSRNSQRYEDGLEYQEETRPRGNYEYSYDIRSDDTGDMKYHQESRDGDKVIGEYRVKEADGSMRVVKYTADKDNGFQATVEYVMDDDHEQEFGRRVPTVKTRDEARFQDERKDFQNTRYNQRTTSRTQWPVDRRQQSSRAKVSQYRDSETSRPEYLASSRRPSVESSAIRQQPQRIQQGSLTSPQLHQDSSRYQQRPAVLGSAFQETDTDATRQRFSSQRDDTGRQDIAGSQYQTAQREQSRYPIQTQSENQFQSQSGAGFQLTDEDRVQTQDRNQYQSERKEIQTSEREQLHGHSRERMQLQNDNREQNRFQNQEHNQFRSQIGNRFQPQDRNQFHTSDRDQNQVQHRNQFQAHGRHQSQREQGASLAQERDHFQPQQGRFQTQERDQFQIQNQFQNQEREQFQSQDGDQLQTQQESFQNQDAKQFLSQQRDQFQTQPGSFPNQDNIRHHSQERNQFQTQQESFQNQDRDQFQAQERGEFQTKQEQFQMQDRKQFQSQKRNQYQPQSRNQFHNQRRDQLQTQRDGLYNQEQDQFPIQQSQLKQGDHFTSRNRDQFKTSERNQIQTQQSSQFQAQERDQLPGHPRDQAHIQQRDQFRTSNQFQSQNRNELRSQSRGQFLKQSKNEQSLDERSQSQFHSQNRNQFPQQNEDTFLPEERYQVETQNRNDLRSQSRRPFQPLNAEQLRDQQQHEIEPADDSYPFHHTQRQYQGQYNDQYRSSIQENPQSEVQESSRVDRPDLDSFNKDAQFHSLKNRQQQDQISQRYETEGSYEIRAQQNRFSNKPRYGVSAQTQMNEGQGLYHQRTDDTYENQQYGQRDTRNFASRQRGDSALVQDNQERFLGIRQKEAENMKSEQYAAQEDEFSSTGSSNFDRVENAVENHQSATYRPKNQYPVRPLEEFNDQSSQSSNYRSQHQFSQMQDHQQAEDLQERIKGFQHQTTTAAREQFALSSSFRGSNAGGLRDEQEQPILSSPLYQEDGNEGGSFRRPSALSQLPFYGPQRDQAPVRIAQPIAQSPRTANFRTIADPHPQA